MSSLSLRSSAVVSAAIGNDKATTTTRRKRKSSSGSSQIAAIKKQLENEEETILLSEEAQEEQEESWQSQSNNNNKRRKHERRKDLWDAMYSHLLTYYKIYGNTLVPRSYETNGGKIKLGRWVDKQRQRKDVISVERKEKLDNVGFVWSIRKESWETMYECLCKFKNKHGHCEVPHKYEPDPKLGLWVTNQRTMRKKKGNLMDDRVKKLNAIGFVWFLPQSTSPAVSRSRSSNSGSSNNNAEGNKKKSSCSNDTSKTAKSNQLQQQIIQQQIQQLHDDQTGIGGGTFASPGGSFVPNTSSYESSFAFAPSSITSANRSGIKAIAESNYHTSWPDTIVDNNNNNNNNTSNETITLHDDEINHWPCPLADGVSSASVTATTTDNMVGTTDSFVTSASNNPQNYGGINNISERYLGFIPPPRPASRGNTFVDSNSNNNNNNNNMLFLRNARSNHYQQQQQQQQHYGGFVTSSSSSSRVGAGTITTTFDSNRSNNFFQQQQQQQLQEQQQHQQRRNSSITSLNSIDDERLFQTLLESSGEIYDSLPSVTSRQQQ